MKKWNIIFYLQFSLISLLIIFPVIGTSFTSEKIIYLVESVKKTELAYSLLIVDLLVAIIFLIQILPKERDREIFIWIVLQWWLINPSIFVYANVCLPALPSLVLSFIIPATLTLLCFWIFYENKSKTRLNQ